MVPRFCCVVLVLVVVPLFGQDGPAEPSGEHLAKVKAAFAGIGAKDEEVTDPRTRQRLPGFRLPGTARDAHLKMLLNPEFPFALSLWGSQVTNAGMKHVGTFKTLVVLDLRGTDVTDAGLKELRDLKNLAALDLAYTSVTAVGLKELKPCRNLTTLVLPETLLTDATFASLREIDLLHALEVMQAKDGGRPTQASEVTRLQLTKTKVTAAGLAELKELKNLTGLELPPDRVTDAALRALRECGLVHTLSEMIGKDGKRPASPAEVSRASLLATKVTDKGLVELQGFQNLTWLELPRFHVTDTALRSLREMGSLHALHYLKGSTDQRPANAAEVTRADLSSTEITNAGLKELHDLKNLAELDLSTTKTTAGGLADLRGFKKLRSLSLSDAQVTDVTLRSLREMGMLHVLDRLTGSEAKQPTHVGEVTTVTLKNSPVTDAGLRELKDLKNLAGLTLAGTQVTPAGLKVLTEFEKLTLLVLGGPEVTDAHLEELSAVKSLTGLTLFRTSVTPAGLMKFKQALPGCTVLGR